VAKASQRQRIGLNRNDQEWEVALKQAADVKSHDFTSPCLFDANGNHDRLADNPMILPHLEIKRIEPKVGIGTFQFLFSKLTHDFIQLLADP
jgi:hypothetical protein